MNHPYCEDICEQNVNDALNRFHSDQDDAVKGRLTVLNHLTSDKDLLLGYWGEISPTSNFLHKILLEDSFQDLCQEIIQTISQKLIDPQTQNIIDALDEASEDSEEDQIVLFTTNGKPVYRSERYDPSTGRYSQL